MKSARDLLAALLLAGLITTAITAVAHAEGTFTVAGGGSVKFSGAQIEGGHTLTLPGSRKLHCGTAQISGTIANNGTAVESTPFHANCSMEIGVGGSVLPATTTWEGCTWLKVFTAKTTFVWHVHTTLNCPGTNSARLHVYENHQRHTEGLDLCRFVFTEQTVNGSEF